MAAGLWQRILQGLFNHPHPPTRNTRQRSARRAVELQIETLEARLVPANGAFSSLADPGTLSSDRVSVATTVPSITVTAGPTVGLGSGARLTASANLSQAINPAGSITFTLYGPNGHVVDTELVAVNGVGTYTTPTGFLPGLSGVYQWSASYSGDGTNAPASVMATIPTQTLTGVSDHYGMTFDRVGNLYVAESLPSKVAVFAPGSTTPTRFLTGVINPTAVAFDPRGNLFVASAFSSTLARFAPGSTTPSTYLTGVSNPQGLAFDAGGNLFVTNYNSNTVTEYTPGSTSPTATLTGLVQPGSLAFDSSGNLFVCNGNNTVSKFSPGSLTPTATLTGITGAGSVAADSAGNVFVSNNNVVSEFAPGSLTPTATLTGASGALAFDKLGNLFVVNHSASTVSEFSPGSLTPTATLTGLSLPIGIAFNGQDDVYVGSWGNGTVSVFASGLSPQAVIPPPGALLQVAGALTHSDEYYQKLITGLYQQLLGRQPDAAGLAAWLNQMKAGMSNELVEAGFFSSPEYIGSHPGTAGWVQAMYNDLLDRTPTAAEVQSWVDALASHTLREVANRFAHAADAALEGLFLANTYIQYLSRPAEAGIIADGWLPSYLHGNSNENIIADFISSPEYFIKHNNDVHAWLWAAYEDVLGRAPLATDFQAWQGILRAG